MCFLITFQLVFSGPTVINLEILSNLMQIHTLSLQIKISKLTKFSLQNEEVCFDSAGLLRLSNFCFEGR